ncbi:MAG: glutamate racemase [Bacteroides sp.]|nr:glutamate racemase [Prevotella sp.]MCM1407525.1 glutamate racemase [Treponema brennaborense]MCM1470015.1 glutamate racemase [Bacteroides sp.]
MHGCDFGFLDSGTGGLSYMLYLKKFRPQCRCVYLADTRNFPYGEKTSEQIRECAANAAETLMNLCSPRVIVIACNTMSVTALDSLRCRFAVPFVGTVPAVKLAASLSKTRRLGLLATRHTVSHPYTDKLIADFASDCAVIKRGDPELVEFVERRLFSASYEERLAAVMPAVEFFKAENVDTIILGCTHFIHLAEELQKAAGSAIRVIDSRGGVMKQALKLAAQDFPAAENAENISAPCVEDMSFYITGNADGEGARKYQALAEQLHIRYKTLPE